MPKIIQRSANTCGGIAGALSLTFLGAGGAAFYATSKIPVLKSAISELLNNILNSTITTPELSVSSNFPSITVPIQISKNSLTALLTQILVQQNFNITLKPLTQDFQLNITIPSTPLSLSIQQISLPLLQVLGSVMNTNSIVDTSATAAKAFLIICGTLLTAMFLAVVAILFCSYLNTKGLQDEVHASNSTLRLQL